MPHFPTPAQAKDEKSIADYALCAVVLVVVSWRSVRDIRTKE